MPAAVSRPTGKRSRRGRLSEGAPTLHTKPLTDSIAESIFFGLTNEESAAIALHRRDRRAPGSAPDRVSVAPTRDFGRRRLEPVVAHGSERPDGLVAALLLANGDVVPRHESLANCSSRTSADILR